MKKDFGVLMFRAILICAVISVLAGLAIQRGHQVKELEQRVDALENKTASLEVEIMKNWGEASINLMGVLARRSAPTGELRMEIYRLQMTLMEATDLMSVQMVCDNILRYLKEVSANEAAGSNYKPSLDWYIGEYKRLMGIPAVHPNNDG